jgi:hypothetical protein
MFGGRAAPFIAWLQVLLRNDTVRSAAAERAFEESLL